nr:immunoglobulin light chain junction region [Macaca mulatta]
YQQYNSFPFTF